MFQFDFEKSILSMLQEGSKRDEYFELDRYKRAFEKVEEFYKYLKEEDGIEKIKSNASY